MLDTNDTALEHAPGVLMVGLSSSQLQCHRKHIISSLLHNKSMPHSKRYTLTNGKCIAKHWWASYLYCTSPIVILHMWERGGGRCLVTGKYKSVFINICTTWTWRAYHSCKHLSHCNVWRFKGQRAFNNWQCQWDASHPSVVYLHKTNRDATFKIQEDIINKV